MAAIRYKFNCQLIKIETGFCYSKYLPATFFYHTGHGAIVMGKHCHTILYSFTYSIEICFGMATRNYNAHTGYVFYEIHGSFNFWSNRPSLYYAISLLKNSHIVFFLRRNNISGILSTFLVHIKIWALQMRSRHPGFIIPPILLAGL